MSELAILGASGHGKVIADAAALDPRWTKISFFDDAWPNTDTDLGWTVEGTSDDLSKNIDRYEGVVVGVGDNATRQRLHEALAIVGARFATIVHPRAYVSPYATVGQGSVVFANAVVNIGAGLGRGAIVNTASSVDHDCRVADFVHISPGASLGGDVTVGDRAWIGIGASVRHGGLIGADAMVGAGATVIKPVADGQTVLGTPARPR